MSTDERIPALEQKTVIAYYDPFNVFKEVKNTFLTHLPLTNLHWNHPLRPLRTIPKLDVAFVEETSQYQAAPKHQILGMSPAPYLKIAFARCDDIETYRTTVRNGLREWFAKSIESVRDPTEWLIIHYVPSGGKAASGNRFKYGVFDKIKADFNASSKTNRVIQIKHDYASEAEKNEAWKDLISHVKEAMFSSFSTRVDVYQDEINKLESERHVLGWNFSKFFVMKEGLALAFEQMNLFEDALLLYDELEASYDQRTENRSVSMFSSIGFDTLSEPLLVLQQKNEYRHAILSNKITLFDFLCYLFGRQSHLLLCIAKMSTPMSIASTKVGELFLRLRSFLGETTSILEHYHKSVQSISEWSYNICEEFINATSWANVDIIREVAEGRGELILIKRESLETIAKAKGWLIKGALSEIPLDTENDDDEPYEVKNKNMKEYLANSETFYSYYRLLTKEALEEFQVADRVRIHNRLTAQLALLEYQLGDYETAMKYLESIPNLYNRQGWDLISTSLLAVYIECLKHFNLQEDTLINSLELLSRYTFLSPNDIKSVISTVQTLADNVSCSANFDSFFTAEVDTTIVTASGSDTYQIKIKIENPLKNEMNFDSASLTMRNVNDSSDVLTFEVKKGKLIVLNPGYTTLTFENRKFELAKFKVTALFFTRGRLTFTKKYMDETPILLALYPTDKNLHASFKIPPQVHLSDRRIGLLIESGNNQIDSGQIIFKGVTPGLKMMSLKAKSEPIDGNEAKMSVLEGRPPIISLTNLNANKQLMITIPFVVDFDVANIRLKATIDYTTNAGNFQYVLDDTIDISLALSVNVQDFYKANRLFSKFTVSCNRENEPVRIIGTELKSSDTFEISSPSGSSKTSISYPDGPVSFVFCIKKKQMLPIANNKVPLTIKYRLVKSEYLARLEKAVNAALENTKFDQYAFLVKGSLENLPLDLISYLQSNRILLSKESWYTLRTAKAFSILGHLQREELIEHLGEHVSQYLVNNSISEEETDLANIFKPITHELVIPVFVPQVHIVHNLELVLPDKGYFSVGKSIEAILRISTVQGWAPAGEEDIINNTTRFVYDLQAGENWAYSGKKRSFFQVSDEMQQFKVTLIPLRAGKLVFPQVEIQFLGDLQTQFSMETNYRNEHQFTVVVPELSDKLTLTF